MEDSDKPSRNIHSRQAVLLWCSSREFVARGVDRSFDASADFVRCKQDAIY